MDETRRISKRFTAGLVLIAAGFFTSCATEDHTVEITALREGVADTQSLVDEYRARVADLKASTPTFALEGIPPDDPAAGDCSWDHPAAGSDPPIGTPSPSDEPLRVAEMRLRPGYRSQILVPESWMAEHDDCRYADRALWINPLDDRERVAHRVGSITVDERSPARDATRSINWLLSEVADFYAVGETVRITEPVLCRFDFELEAEGGYITAGTWLDLGDAYAVASISVAVDTPVIDDFRDQFESGLGWSPLDFDDYGPGPRRCHAFSETVVDRFGPIGSILGYRPDGPDPLNSEIDNTCLRHLGDYPERIQLTDGSWEADTDDIEDIRADRRMWKHPGVSGHSSRTNVQVARVAYADLLPEPEGDPVLEIIIGVVCNANEGVHADIQILSSTGSGLERIGLPIDGFFAGLSSTADTYEVYQFRESWVPERVHVARPWIFEWGFDHVDGTALCCVTDRYAFAVEWRDGAWSLVDEDAEPASPINESTVFESLLQVNPSLDGCSYSDLGYHVPGPFREGGGDNISMNCYEFKPDGSRPAFEIDIDYPLRVKAGVADPVDDHVRSAVKKHLDQRLSEDLGAALFYGPNFTSLPSQLIIEGEVTFQSGRLYSVALPVYYYWPGAAHGDNVAETVNVDVKIGELLELADLFDPATDWLPALLEAVDAAAEANYPRCGWGPSETDPGSGLKWFNITPTHLRIYLGLAPNACRVQPVQVGYSDLADYLDSEFLDHLSTPLAAGAAV